MRKLKDKQIHQKGLQDVSAWANEIKPILTSLQEQGIEDVYIEILEYIYTDSSVTVHLHKESEIIRMKRGARQGAPSHPSCSRQHWRALFRRLDYTVYWPVSSPVYLP